MRIEIILLLFCTTLIAAWSLFAYNKSVKRRREESERIALEREALRQRQREYFTSLLASARTAEQTFGQLIEYRNGYFSNYDLTIWKEGATKLFKEIGNRSFKDIGLSDNDVSTLASFLEHFKNGEQIRQEYNSRFVTDELIRYTTFFNSVEGRSLDNQQRMAIVTDDDNTIVIAGAGSGKTTTIVGKVNYVINRYDVDPASILLISFTNKSAATLASRVNVDGVSAKTFHKFGMDVIAAVEGKQPSIFDENQFKPLIIRRFTELLKNNDYLSKVTDYFLNYLKPPKSQFDFENQGSYIQYIKDQNFRTYKSIAIPTNGRQTYKMEVVKSIEECKIANFLLFNGLNYEYELPYEFDTANDRFRQYKPDFTVKQGGRKYYIEHFALSRSGSVPPFFAKDGETLPEASARYQEKIRWARELHQNNDTPLVETFSYEMNEGTLFNNLSANLTALGIILTPKSPEEIWQLISSVAKDEVGAFTNLFATFIALMKSNNYSISQIKKRNSQITDDFTKRRNDRFLEIIEPIFSYYEEYLKERGEIDFSDMINKASNYILEGRYQHNFRYVIVDEFQDISIGRYRLIKSIKERNPSCKLFCVGDDWQSIYRFSGSDIALFKEFQKYFGYTVKSKIETTYRFCDPLISLSSDFIQKNPNQARKALKPKSATGRTEYFIRYSSTEVQDDTEALKGIFDELLLSDSQLEQKEVLVLGRYGFDIDRIKNGQGIFDIDKSEGRITYRLTNEGGYSRTLVSQFMTVHKAKGLEAEIVIVINCNSGKYGFPSEMSDDTVLNLLLSESDQFENGEERRLFYVAMTRAKEKLFLVADSAFKSKFINELEVESGDCMIEKCPRCKTADVLLRKTGTARTGSQYKFYGCSNYLFGCDFTKTEWQN